MQEQTLLLGIRNEVGHLWRSLENPGIEQNLVDALVLRSEILYSHLLCKRHAGIAGGIVNDGVLEILRYTVKHLQEASEVTDESSNTSGASSLIVIYKLSGKTTIQCWERSTSVLH